MKIEELEQEYKKLISRQNVIREELRQLFIEQFAEEGIEVGSIIDGCSGYSGVRCKIQITRVTCGHHLEPLLFGQRLKKDGSKHPSHPFKITKTDLSFWRKTLK